MKKPIFHFKKVFILLSIILFSCSYNDGQDIQSQEKDIELDTILKSWGNTFCEKIDSSYNAIINFTETENDSACHIIITNNQYHLYEGLNDNANFAFKSSLDHYNKIYRQEITAFTSIGRENISDKTPLDVEFYKPITDNLMNDVLYFVQRFFNTSAHDKVILKEEYSRIVHGGHAIPLFYNKSDDLGVRSAWYLINKDQRINEPGDTNPFPQYFIVIKGQGFAKIGNDTLIIKENEAFYVAPGLDHVFWNESEEPIELIFLAWGKGA
jgi:mannose-6-phosphate isomerase-like protein (cupin superfamily)